jgi:hypothetical protein
MSLDDGQSGYIIIFLRKNKMKTLQTSKELNQELSDSEDRQYPRRGDIPLSQ